MIIQKQAVLNEGKSNQSGFNFKNKTKYVNLKTPHRTAVQLRRPDIPTKMKSKSRPDSTTNQFIEFTHTDIDADVAQTTIPYIDAQDATSFPPVPLTGVGIFHKGQDLSGGFIAPKLITFDFAPHIQTPQPTENQLNVV